jgi:hypothetical protein
MKHLYKGLVVLVGLALPVPLLWIVSLASPTWSSPWDTGKGVRLVPHLTRSKRAELMTYGHTCSKDEECQPPLACFYDHHGSWCADAQCMTDADCGEGFICEPRASKAGTALVHVCTPIGARKEGEQCEEWPESKDQACEAGLICQEWCGRPCDPSSPQGCPEGFSCRQRREGAVCLPNCEGYQCPEGQQCIKMNEEVSACYRVRGTNCDKTPCPEGYRCMAYRTKKPGVLRMGCDVICTPGGNECPDGTTCFISICLRPCKPGVPDSCSPGATCARLAKDSPWFCRSTR